MTVNDATSSLKLYIKIINCNTSKKIFIQITFGRKSHQSNNISFVGTTKYKEIKISKFSKLKSEIALTTVLT